MSSYQNMSQAALGQLSGLGAHLQMNPLEGVNIRNLSMKDLETMLLLLTQEYDRRTMDTPLQGPTRRQLQTDETLKNAWEQYEIIAKLKGK